MPKRIVVPFRVKRTASPSLFCLSRKRLLENVRKLKNPKEFTFVVLGDSWAGDGHTSNDIFSLSVEAIRNMKKKPLFAIHTGDAVFTGTDQEFKTGGVYSGVPVQSFLQILQDKDKGIPDIPFFVVPGNHERTGINGPLAKFRQFIGPTRFSINIPKIKTTIIGLNNIQQFGRDKNNRIIYGFPPTELSFLKRSLTSAQNNTMVAMHVPPRVGKWANPNYFRDTSSTFGNQNGGQLTQFLKIIRGKVPHVFVGHVHAFDTLAFQGTRYVLTGGAGASLVKAGFLKGTRTPIFHIVEFTVRNGTVVRRRVIPVGFEA